MCQSHFSSTTSLASIVFAVVLVVAIVWLYGSSVYQSGKNPLFYEHLYSFANKISLTREVTSIENFREYLIVKNNDTYDKYSLQKELFNKMQNIENEIHLIKNDINNKVKFFGIYNSDDKIIIYFFGIRISIKKRK